MPTCKKGTRENLEAEEKCWGLNKTDWAAWEAANWSCFALEMHLTECKLYISLEDCGGPWGKQNITNAALRSISSEQTKETEPCQCGVRMLTLTSSLTALLTLSRDSSLDFTGTERVVNQWLVRWAGGEITGEGEGGEPHSVTGRLAPGSCPPHLSPLSSPQQLLVCCYWLPVWGWGRQSPPHLSLCCKINPSWCSLLAVAWCLLTAWLGLPSITDWGMRSLGHTHWWVLLL